MLVVELDDASLEEALAKDRVQRPTELRPQGSEVGGDCLDASDKMLPDLQVRELGRVERRSPGAQSGRLPGRGLIDPQSELARKRQIDHRWRDGNVQQRRERAFPSQEDRNDYLVLDQAEVDARLRVHDATLRGMLRGSAFNRFVACGLGLAL